MAKDKSSKIKKPFYKKIWFIALILIIVVAAINGGKGEEKKEVVKSPVVKDPIVDQPIVEEPVAELSLEDDIETRIKKVTGEKTNREGVAKIISIDINDDAGSDIEGDKIVLVKLNSDDNLTSNFRRTGIFNETRDIIKSLSDIEEISEVTVFSHFPLVDKFGQSKDEVILKIGMTKETIGKINWDNFSIDNFENVADQYFEHPALKK